MPRYSVNYSEQRHFNIVVEADSPEEAESMIEARYADTDSATENLSHPIRIVNSVEEIEGNNV